MVANSFGLYNDPHVAIRSPRPRNAISAARNASQGRDIAYNYDQTFFNLGIDSAAYVGLDSGGRKKGLFAECATRSAPLLSVPLSSCLICGNNVRSLGFGASQSFFPESLSVILNQQQLPCQGIIQASDLACMLVIGLEVFMSTLLSSFRCPPPHIQMFDAGEGALFTKIAALILWISSGLRMDGDRGSRDVLAGDEHWDTWKQYLRMLPRQEELTNLMSFNAAEVSWLQIPELMVSPLHSYIPRHILSCHVLFITKLLLAQDECNRQRSWAKQQHERHLRPLSKSVDDSLWALGLVRPIRDTKPDMH